MQEELLKALLMRQNDEKAACMKHLGAEKD